VRVIDYQVAPGQRHFRLVTSLLDPASAPAAALAALYPQRWEHEGVYDEFKTHLRGAQVVLRSKTPDLVRQEFFGLCLAHYAVRGLMLEAADQDTLDPTAFPSPTRFASFVASWPPRQFFPPPDRDHRHGLLLDELRAGRAASSRGRAVPRGVKRKMSNFHLRPRGPRPTCRPKFRVVLLNLRP
jgi:hypothetical protein